MQTPVPALTHSLKALSAIIAKAEAHCTAKKINPAVLFGDRLYPDMLPFNVQVQIACDHAKGAAARLSGTENPKFEDNAASFADLQDRIARTIAFIGTVPESAFEGAENRTVEVKAGPRELSFPGQFYLSSYAIPNFYFHMATAYNILRHNGVELGKVDFIGGA
ncbi:MAG: DUF1993 domain-containing protein [Rhodobacterales bacterium]|jgi:uncharacterized protein|nr:DUF1993 domain-containing protein [Rhodobacterales bacterium]